VDGVGLFLREGFVEVQVGFVLVKFGIVAVGLVGLLCLLGYYCFVCGTCGF
jgi:hypothetical protein